MNESETKREKRIDTEPMAFIPVTTAKVNVANLENDTIYTLTVKDVTAISCTCKDYKYRQGPSGDSCKHMQAYEAEQTATDSTHDISGPHVGVDKLGKPDHRYWRCEECGTETVDRRYLDETDCDGVENDETNGGRC